jgi:hypothetical protein
MKAIKSTYTRAVTGTDRELYHSNLMYATGGLQNELEWRFENSCLFHELIYSELDRKNKALDEYVERNKEIIRGVFNDDADLLVQSRHRTFIHDNEDIINSIHSLGDESTAIGLWAIIEQFTSRAYVLLESSLEKTNGADIDPPYRWDRLKVKYANYGITLEYLPEHETINELRVVNNKIKHLYRVDVELAGFSRFFGCEGKAIKQITLPMQEYADGCYKFLGCLLERVGIEIEGFLTGSTR